MSESEIIYPSTTGASDGNGIYGGSGTLSADTTVDLNGKILAFSQSGTPFLQLTTTVDNEQVYLGAFNTNVSGQAGRFIGLTTATNATAVIEATSNNGSNYTYISLLADATTSTLAYSADSHTFTGNVGIGVTPSADQLFVVHTPLIDAIEVNITSFETKLNARDGTAFSQLAIGADLVGNSVYFGLNLDDGTNTVSINADAIAQTITMTAANGVGINMTSTIASPLAVSGLTNYANNAAAILGGLIAGMFYYTDVAGDGILKVVI